MPLRCRNDSPLAPPSRVIGGMSLKHCAATVAIILFALLVIFILLTFNIATFCLKIPWLFISLFLKQNDWAFSKSPKCISSRYCNTCI